MHNDYEMFTLYNKSWTWFIYGKHISRVHEVEWWQECIIYLDFNMGPFTTVGAKKILTNQGILSKK